MPLSFDVFRRSPVLPITGLFSLTSKWISPTLPARLVHARKRSDRFAGAPRCCISNTRMMEGPMARSWSREEIEELLTHATPIVRQFLKGLAAKGTASADDIGVSHLAPVIGLRYTKSRGKESFYSSKKDEGTGKSVFTIDPKYRRRISDFLATFRAPAPQPKRRPGRPRSVAVGLAPRRGPGRPRKVPADVVVVQARRRGRPPKVATTFATRSNGSFVLPADALQSWSFWANLVAFANQATKGGASLVLETDGQGLQVKASR